MSTIVLNRMAMTEVSNMVKLLNEAFQFLWAFNLDFRGCIIKFRVLMSSEKSFGCGWRLRELPPSRDAA